MRKMKKLVSSRAVWGMALGALGGVLVLWLGGPTWAAFMMVMLTYYVLVHADGWD